MARSCQARECYWRARYFTGDVILFSIHFAPILRKRNQVSNSKNNCDDAFPARSMKPKKTILCVDDNEQALSIRKILLETRGYRVFACNNGVQALEAFRRGGIDLVLTDLVMPGVDGSRLIEEIKNLSPQTPVVLISGRVKIYERETQADLFLPKGMYEPAELLERIRLLLVRKRGPKRQLELRPRAVNVEHATVA
jgi:two-component system, OmpR family, response regulator CpxR